MIGITSFDGANYFLRNSLFHVNIRTLSTSTHAKNSTTTSIIATGQKR